MRILHLYKDYFPVLGGIENHIKMLAEAQAARGHEVSVLVTSRDGHTHVETINGVRVLFAARLATISSAPLSIEFARLLVRERPEVTHLHFPYPIGEVANYFFGHAKRTVLTYHSDIVRQKYLRVAYAPLMVRVLARVDKIIATSPNYIASSPVLSHWKEKCVVVPLGIPASPLTPPERQKAGRGDTATRRHGDTEKAEDERQGTEGGQQMAEDTQIISESVPSLHPSSGTSLPSRDFILYPSERGEVLFVGRLRYYKGLNYLLQAMCELPTVRLTVVGTGPMEQAWRKLALDLGIAGQVNFAGDIADEQLPAYYAACDVFVLPASERSEAFGAVQLEAMAAGKPVVSTDVGTGVAWVNQNEVTGFVVPPRDPQALAGAIQRLLSDGELRKRMGAAGQARVRENFTLDRMVEDVMKVYGS